MVTDQGTHPYKTDTQYRTSTFSTARVQSFIQKRSQLLTSYNIAGRRMKREYAALVEEYRQVNPEVPGATATLSTTNSAWTSGPQMRSFGICGEQSGSVTSSRQEYFGSPL